MSVVIIQLKLSTFKVVNNILIGRYLIVKNTGVLRKS